MSQYISVATESYYSFPLLQALQQKKLLKEVVLTERARMYARTLEQFLTPEQIRICEDPASPFHSTTEKDMLVTYGYPYKVTPYFRVINIHFGPLPENRGPDPVFWTLKHGKQLAYVSIHLLNDSFDSGDVLIERSLNILPGETYGMLSGRLCQFSVQVFEEMLANELSPQPQDEHKAKYHARPDDQDLAVNWNEMSASEIENLINACNPKYGGCHTSLNGFPVKLIEVSQLNSLSPEMPPGTILANTSGEVVVACIRGGNLRVDVISLDEGVISGKKLATIALPKGSAFS